MHAGSKELTESVRYRKAQRIQPEIGVVLGTGLGDEFVSRIRHPVFIPYNSIPFFPVSTVSGHKGQFAFGEVAGKKMLVRLMKII